MVGPYKKNINSEEKEELARFASLLVKDHSVIGVGSGTTIEFFLVYLSERMEKEKMNLKFIASSNKIAKKAEELDLVLIEIEETHSIDQAFDGADRVDGNANLIKGGGGSLFRERQVLLKSEERYILADCSKFKEDFSGQVIPLEIIPFNAFYTIERIEVLGYKAALRKDGESYFITDNGNWVVDVTKDINEPLLNIYEQLKLISGVVEVGLFLNDDFRLVKPKQLNDG